MMKGFTLQFLRHPTDIGNSEGKYIGRSDVPLTADSEMLLKQAEEYAPPVDIVFTSPLQRCRRTAELLYPNTPHIAVENLTELCMGEWDGKKIDELKDDKRYHEWLANSRQVQIPGGRETMDDFMGRITLAIDQIVGEMGRESSYTAAVVTHGGVILSLLSAYGMPKLDPSQLYFGQVGGFSVRIENMLWFSHRVMEVKARIDL